MIVPRSTTEGLPVGVFNALCIDIFYYRTSYQGNFYDACAILFELDAKRSDGKAHWLCREYAFLMSAKKPTKLQNLLASWRGRAFTAEEIGAFDLDNVKGHHAQVQLAEVPSPASGEMRVELVLITPIRKGSKPVARTIPLDFVPEWVQKRLGARQEQDSPASQGPGHARCEEFPDDVPF